MSSVNFVLPNSIISIEMNGNNLNKNANKQSLTASWILPLSLESLFLVGTGLKGLANVLHLLIMPLREAANSCSASSYSLHLTPTACCKCFPVAAARHYSFRLVPTRQLAHIGTVKK